MIIHIQADLSASHVDNFSHDVLAILGYTGIAEEFQEEQRMIDRDYLRLRGRAGGLTTIARYGGKALNQKGVAAKKAKWAETGDAEAACRAEMAKLTLIRKQKQMARKACEAPMSIMSMPGKRVCPDCCFRQMKPFPIDAIPRRCKRHANMAA